jgi:hypothetical protein
VAISAATDSSGGDVCYAVGTDQHLYVDANDPFRRACRSRQRW